MDGPGEVVYAVLDDLDDSDDSEDMGEWRLGHLLRGGEPWYSEAEGEGEEGAEREVKGAETARRLMAAGLRLRVRVLVRG